MKQILVLLAIIIISDSCGNKVSDLKIDVNNGIQNYVIILDLSDRLIMNSNQIDIDTTAIRSGFDKFEGYVRKNLVVKSRDKFSIRIIPQKNSSLPINSFENNLTIDLAIYNAADKLAKLNEFKEKLGETLKMLYQQAYLGNSSSKYFGVDIWQYFDEQINSDIKEGCSNHVLVLTDGYFDFEDKGRGIINGNQSTTSRQLINKLKDNNWKEIAEENNIGILPVKLRSNARFLIVGIQSKSDDLLESSKLSYLWTKWLVQSGVKEVTHPIINASSVKIKDLVKQNF